MEFFKLNKLTDDVRVSRMNVIHNTRGSDVHVGETCQRFGQYLTHSDLFGNFR